MQTGLERLPLGSNAEATEDRNEYGGQAWKPDSEIFHAVSTCCTESTHAGLTINGNKSVPLVSKLAGDRASGQANSLILLSWRRQTETGCRLPTDAVQIVAHGSSRIVPRQIGPEWRFCDGFRGL